MEMPPIHGERPSVSINMNTPPPHHHHHHHHPPHVWLGYFPSGIYQVAVASGPASTAPRCHAPCLFAKLAHPCLMPRAGQVAFWFSLVRAAAPRLGYQLQQVWLGTQPAIQFIGLQFSMCAYIMAPLPRMQVKIQNTLDNWRSNPSITARNVHGILGLLTFMATLVPWGQMHLHRIKWWATEAWCQEVGFWSNQITVTPTIPHQVAQWASPAIFQTYSHWATWGGWGCGVSRGGHHRRRGKNTMGSALDGAVLDFTQILAYLVHNISRSQLYLGYGHFGWFPSFFGQ